MSNVNQNNNKGKEKKKGNPIFLALLFNLLTLIFTDSKFNENFLGAGAKCFFYSLKIILKIRFSGTF